MERDDTINLAVFETSPDEAEYIATELRNGGHVVKSYAFKNRSELEKTLKGNRIDLILSSTDPDELTGVCRMAESPDYRIPVIAIAPDTDIASVVVAIRGGARDLISRNQPDHMRLVIERELESTKQCRNARNFMDAYNESEKRCRNLLDSSRDAIAYIHDGMHIYANGVYVEKFGFEDAEDLEGLPILDMVAEDEHARFKAFITNYGKQKNEENVEVRCVRDDGTEFEAAMEFTRASIDGEACTQVIIRDQGISETVINELELLKTQDPVTGLYHRRAYLEEIDQSISDVRHGHRPGVIFYIEIDKFDSIKSIMGIENIDQAISSIGKTIADTIGEHDFGARFGEHIFTILSREKDVKKIGILSKKLIRALDYVVEAGDKSMHITASMGIASIRSNTKSTYEIIACAESACSEAKKKGGNSIEAYKDPDREAAKQASKAELHWVNLISNALENNQFKLAFQPIVSLREESDEIYEALLRLRDEKGEEIKPGAFLPAAEKTGMINKIDRWVIGRALHLLVEKQRENFSTCLFVKLSGSAFSDESLLPWLYERTKATKVETRRLIFEINEDDAETHIKQIAHFCRTLQKMHCRVVLSRFGLNNEPFRLLKTIPVDFLKVSSKLTGEIGNNPAMMERVTAIVEQGHELDKPMIAPHVEDAESMAVLFQCGFDYLQGNFLQEPDIIMQFDFGDNEASMHRSHVAAS